MLKTSTLRRSHRMLGIVVGLQLLMWTLSGAYFVWTDIDEIHGDHHRAVTVPIAWQQDWVSPTSIDFNRTGIARPTALTELSLVRIGDRIFYRIVDDNGEIVLADVLDGEIRGTLTRDEAVALAQESFAPDVPIKEVQYLDHEDVGPHHEYRGGSLPVWAIDFEHSSSTKVYVAARDGRVTKHRNRSWRIFDFLWMLHTMDYVSRDDFNNPLLRILALAAITVVGSGYFLWVRTSRRRRS